MHVHCPLITVQRHSIQGGWVAWPILTVLPGANAAGFYDHKQTSPKIGSGRSARRAPPTTLGLWLAHLNVKLFREHAPTVSQGQSWHQPTVQANCLFPSAPHWASATTTMGIMVSGLCHSVYTKIIFITYAAIAEFSKSRYISASYYTSLNPNILLILPIDS